MILIRHKKVKWMIGAQKHENDYFQAVHYLENGSSSYYEFLLVRFQWGVTKPQLVGHVWPYQ